MGRGASTDREGERRAEVVDVWKERRECGMGMASWRERRGQRNKQGVIKITGAAAVAQGHATRQNAAAEEALLGGVQVLLRTLWQGLRGSGGGAGGSASLPTSTEVSECFGTGWLIQCVLAGPQVWSRHGQAEGQSKVELAAGHPWLTPS